MTTFKILKTSAQAKEEEKEKEKKEAMEREKSRCPECMTYSKLINRYKMGCSLSNFTTYSNYKCPACGCMWEIKESED